MHPSLARRRNYKGPAFLSFGFRPFFLLAGIWAAAAIPVWLVIYTTGGLLPKAVDPLSWHAHEMIFGYLGAVLTGFLLTAIPNWTGRLPVNGGGLGLLALLWLAGRVVPWLPGLGPSLVAATDVAFLITVAIIAWREVMAGKNWRNLPVALLVTLFAAANVVYHLEGGVVPPGAGQRMALGVAALLIAFIGGRIVPSFTRNWMKQQDLSPLPAEMSAFDKAVLAITLVALVMWVAAPESPSAGYGMVAAGLALLARMWRWRWTRTLSESLVWIMHAGYAFLGLALFLIGAGILWPETFPASAGIHALTAGAIGVMTVAVMTRATLGHSGRERFADRATTLCYVFLILGALVRIVAPFTGFDYYTLLVVSGGLWSSGFVLFVYRYGPLLAK